MTLGSHVVPVDIKSPTDRVTSNPFTRVPQSFSVINAPAASALCLSLSTLARWSMETGLPVPSFFLAVIRTQNFGISQTANQAIYEIQNSKNTNV